MSLSRRVWSLGWGLLLTSATAHASYYGSLLGGQLGMTPSGYNKAFTDNGFDGGHPAQILYGVRVGNESPTGVVRLVGTVFDTYNDKQSVGDSYADVTTTRATGMFQFNFMPADFLSFTAGLGGGFGYSRLTVLSDAANGVYFERYLLVEPVVGIELRFGVDFRLFVEASYAVPFAFSSSNKGSDLGVSQVYDKGYVVLGGLSFYYSL